MSKAFATGLFLAATVGIASACDGPYIDQCDPDGCAAGRTVCPTACSHRSVTTINVRIDPTDPLSCAAPARVWCICISAQRSVRRACCNAAAVDAAPAATATPNRAKSNSASRSAMVRPHPPTPPSLILSRVAHSLSCSATQRWGPSLPCTRLRLFCSSSWPSSCSCSHASSSVARGAPVSPTSRSWSVLRTRERNDDA